MTGDDELKRYEVMLELFFECMLILVQILTFVYLLPKTLGFMWPFVTGWVIAMITYPVSLFLQKKFHINKKFVSALILIGLLAAVSGLLYCILARLGGEALNFMSDLPVLYDKVDGVIGNLPDFFHNMKLIPRAWQPNMDSIFASIKDAVGAMVNQIGAIGVAHAGSIAKNVTNFFIGFIVSILSSYFFVVYRERLSHSYQNWIPVSIQHKLDGIMEQVKGALGGYLFAQIKIMGIIFVILFVGFVLLHNSYALLLAFIVAFVDVIPFLGTGFVLMPWALYNLMAGNYKETVLLVILYLVCLLSRQLLQPKIIGDSVGLHPLLTLVLIYIGFKLDGIRGFLIAMIAGILVRNFYRIGLFDSKIRRFKRLFLALKEADEHL